MSFQFFRTSGIRYTLLFVGVLCISWSAIFVKLSGVQGITTAFYRLFFGSIGLIPVWIFFKKPQYDRRGIAFAMLSGVLFSIDIALWNTSITLSKASISTLLANMAPVWVGIAYLMFWKKEMKPGFWLGTLISIAGVAVIVGFDQIFTTGNHAGNLLAIGASVFYAAYMISTQKGRLSIDTLTFTMVSMWTSSFILLAVCLVFDAPLWGFSTKTWLSLGGLGLIAQMSGWLAINYALGRIKTTTASVSLLSQSVFTAIFSVFVLGERLTFNEITGAIIVLAGIYQVNRLRQ